MSRSPYADLDLRTLDAMWEERARAVEAAKRSLDTAGVVRPPRDPFERDWLAAHGRSGVLAEGEPLAPEQAAERRPTRRRAGSGAAGRRR